MTGELPKKDFAALRRKLAGGKVLAVAAAEAGMSLEEAQAYLTAREDEQDTSLLAFSDEALRVSLMALKRAVKEKNRVTAFGSLQDGMTKEAIIDVDAAKALLKAAMQAKKMLRAEKVAAAGAGAVEKDLFDSPWSFKKSD